MKINFEFENITQLEELFYSVEHIADELQDEFLASDKGMKKGTPIKESVALYVVIKRLERKLLNEKAKRGEL